MAEELVEEKVQEEVKDKEVEKTPAELAAEKRAADSDARAADMEAENEKLKADASSRQARTTATATGYSLGSFSEQEWSDAEGSTGMDRKAILMNLNQNVATKREIRDAVGVLESRLAVQQEKEFLASEDPLYPKYRKEVDKFLSDIPTEMMTTPENRKKWIGKAFEFGRRSVKISSSTRHADNMDTKDSSKPKEKGNDGEYSALEKEIFESHGKTEADYNKMKHPVIQDAIIIREKFQEPKFGPK